MTKVGDCYNFQLLFCLFPGMGPGLIGIFQTQPHQGFVEGCHGFHNYTIKFKNPSSMTLTILLDNFVFLTLCYRKSNLESTLTTSSFSFFYIAQGCFAIQCKLFFIVYAPPDKVSLWHFVKINFI